MKKLLTLLTMGLMSSGAWAGQAVFGNPPDIADSILHEREKPAMMGQRERGEGDLYGTSLEAWGGDVRIGMSEPERGGTDLYGSVLYDVNPKLHF